MTYHFKQQKMTFYFSNDHKKKVLMLRSFELIPAISLHFYDNYKFESIRFSWVGFMIGIGRE